MVNAGLIPLAVVVDYTVTLWSSASSRLKPRTDLGRKRQRFDGVGDPQEQPAPNQPTSACGAPL